MQEVWIKIMQEREYFKRVTEGYAFFFHAESRNPYTWNHLKCKMNTYGLKKIGDFTAAMYKDKTASRL